MKCAECGHANREDVRFCTACGAALFLLCPKCAAPAEENDLYCGACGGRLPAAGKSLPMAATAKPRVTAASGPVSADGESFESERKNVTVLFADISGFTAMSEKLDPEDVTTIMNGCLKMMADTVVHFEGYVDKFIGDCVMAIFGAPITHENDPELAIRAALEMKRQIEDYNKNLPVRLEKPLALHIGINSGVVIAGGVGSDQKMQYTVMGDTVNLASRLESIAGSGEVFVSGYTYNLTRKLFEFNPHEPIKVKGKKDPVAVYEVVKAKANTGETRRAAASAIPLVGRDQEISILRKCAEQLLAGHGQNVFLVSDPGVGKSRIQIELKNRFKDGEVQSIEGVCRSFSQNTSYSVFSEIFRSLLDIDSEDLQAAMAEKIARNLPLLLNLAPESLPSEAKEAIVFIGAMLGVRLGDEWDVPIDQMDGQEVKLATFRSISWFFSQMAQVKPLMLTLENLHHADNTSVELIAYLFDVFKARPIMLLLLMRPNREHASSKLPLIARKAHEDHTTVITVERLTAAECDQFVSYLIGTEKVPDALLQLVRSRADGNPLFMEEIVRGLLEGGVVRRNEDGTVEVVENLANVAIPSSIQGMIIARIDRLQPGLKDILQTAAVVGPVFKQALMERLIKVRDLEDRLNQLIEMGMIFESSSFPEIDYSFRNVLIQEAVYSTLLLKKRKELHAVVAREIEALYPNRLDDHVEVLAEHYRQAENSDKCYHYLVRSGLKTKQAYSNQDAANYLRQAIEIGRDLDAADPPLETAYIALSDALEMMGDLDGATEAWRAVTALMSDDRQKANALRNIGRIEEKRGDPEKASAVYDEAAALLTAHPDSIEAGQLYLNQSWVLNRLKDYDAAIAKASAAMEIFEASQATEDISRACNNLAVIHEHQGDLEKALAFNQRSLALAEEAGERRLAGNAYLSLGFLHGKRGEPETALDYFDQAFETMYRIGNRIGAGTAMLSKGQGYLELGRLDEAETALLHALRIHRELNLRRRLGRNQLALADVYIAKGAFEKAAQQLDAVEAISKEQERAADLAAATETRARLLLAQGLDPVANFEAAIAQYQAIGQDRDAERVSQSLARYQSSAAAE